MKELRTKLALLTVGIGCWLIASALSFFRFSCISCTPLMWSDLISGLLLVVLGLIARSPHRSWAGWVVGVVGVWLQFAPLLFWSTSLAVYLTDTLIGALSIVFAFQMYKPARAASVDCPRGWSYNPSSWTHRLPTVGLAMLCWFFSRYMAAFQLGYVSNVWDPFFPVGTFHVITSDVSSLFPVSDAGLGALCYTLEALLGWQGDKRRWATMPWLVAIFAFLVIAVGLVSIILIILQPIIVGAWCTWCLATALCMLIMVMLTAGEFVAVLQFLKESKRRGESAWKVFWLGGVEVKSAQAKPRVSREFAWGISLPWNLVLAALLGLTLMILPTIMQVEGKLAINDYVLGPIMITFSLIAFAEVFRALRLTLVVLAIWLIVSCFIFSSSGWGFLSHLSIGLLVLICALCKSPVEERYGKWEKFIL